MPRKRLSSAGRLAMRSSTPEAKSTGLSTVPDECGPAFVEPRFASGDTAAVRTLSVDPPAAGGVIAGVIGAGPSPATSVCLVTSDGTTASPGRTDTPSPVRSPDGSNSVLSAVGQLADSV